MRIRKGVPLWLLWTFAAGVLHLFGNNAGTFVIFTVSAALPPFSAILSLAAPANITVELEIPNESAKGEKINGILTVKNNGGLPVPRITCRAECENPLTGEHREYTIRLGVRRKSAEIRRFETLSRHCGNLKVTVGGFFITDIFGMLSRRLDVSASGSVLILPETFDTQISFAGQTGASSEGGEYSATTPGLDSSETFAIREYIPGDPIKSVHWKISQKTDTLMVREFGLPVSDRILLLLDYFPKREYALADAMAEIFASLMYSLVKSGVPHTAGFRNPLTDEFEFFEIGDQAGADSAIRALLAAPAHFAGEMSAVRLTGCAHTGVISAAESPCAESVDGGRTTILYADGSDGGIAPDVPNALSFSADNYKDILSVLEL